ncbi:MAG: hypothetical protein AAFO89_03370 [Planctomycetota bacterium]
MTKGIRIKAVVIDVIAAVCAVASCVGILSFFADAFTRGATWSGLNPGGGGPGFLLLIATGVVSIVSFRRAVAENSVLFDVLWSAAFAALCGLFFVASTALLERLPTESVAPLASGIVGAFFVPRVVISVLQDTWARAEREAQPETS